MENHDIVHFQWPEYVFRGGTRFRRTIKGMLGFLFLTKIALQRTPVVYTVHNRAPHEPPRFIERALMHYFNRLVTVCIYLNEDPDNDPTRGVVLLHGRYDATGELITENAGPTTVVTFGLIRPYKGIEQLISAFAEIQGEEFRLHIAGQPSDALYGQKIKELAAEDRRIFVQLEYIPEETLERIINDARLVVLPYTRLYNSGAVILALGLATPVLVPDSGSTATLSAEVGNGWVNRYKGKIQGRDIALALAVRPDHALPDFARREWDSIGLCHANLYSVAVTAAKSSKGRRQSRILVRRAAENDPMVSDHSTFNVPRNAASRKDHADVKP